MQEFEKIVEELLNEILATNMGIIIAICMLGLLLSLDFILLRGLKKNDNK